MHHVVSFGHVSKLLHTSRLTRYFSKEKKFTKSGWSRQRYFIMQLHAMLRTGSIKAKHQCFKLHALHFDSRINPFIDVLHLSSQVFRVEVQVSLFLCFAECIHFCVEHAYDLAGFIVDNRLFLFVPQTGHSVPASVSYRGEKIIHLCKILC